MRQKQNYKSVFTSIFLSYLIISLIVLVITAFTYFYFYRLLRNQILISGYQQAELIVTELDGELERLNSITEVLTTNSDLKKFMEYTNDELSMDVTNLLQLISELKNSTQSDTRINTLVYFTKSHSMLDLKQRRYNEELMDLFVKSRGLSMGEFENIMNALSTDGNYVFENGTVWIMKPVYNLYFEKGAVVILEIHLDNFLEMNSDQNILTIVGDDIVLFSSGIEKDTFSAYLQESPERKSADFEQDNYYFAHCEIPSQGWQCYVGLSKTPLWIGLRVFWYVLVGEIIGAILLTVLMSWRITEKMYQPIAQLMDLLNTSQNVKFKDIYVLLNDRLEQLMNDNRRIKKNSEESQVFLVNHQINLILNGAMKNKHDVEQTLQSFAGIQSPKPWMMVLLSIQENNNYIPLSDTNSQNTPDLELFVLKNIVDELIFRQYAGNICWQDEYYYLFIAFQNDSDYEDITEKLQYLKDFYGDILHTSLHIVVGNILYQADGIVNQRTMLQDELRYHLFWMDDETYKRIYLLQKPEQQSWPETSFTDYTDASRKLFNFLEAKDYMNAYKTLDYIFNHTFSRDPKYLRYNIYRMYGLSAMLTMAILEQTDEEDQEFLKKLSFEEKLLGARNSAELIEISKNIITLIVEHDSEKENSSAPAWLTGVIQYIEANYNNPNLTVAEIADKFWISLSHLSRTFKSFMNYGVLEYIQMLRVEKAKSFLSEGKTVNETSILVGYLDSRALSRAFKHAEGITPGKYRENANINQSK